MHTQPLRLRSVAEQVRAKCRLALKRHRLQARKDGMDLDYGILELVQLAERVQQCPYCKMPLGPDSQFDHIEPVCRGGPGCHRLANLAVCCRTCNTLKGSLSGAEFLGLLAWLATIDPRGQYDVRRRLTGGVAAVYGRKRT